MPVKDWHYTGMMVETAVCRAALQTLFDEIRVDFYGRKVIIQFTRRFDNE
jgi:hypothetical protein